MLKDKFYSIILQLCDVCEDLRHLFWLDFAKIVKNRGATIRYFFNNIVEDKINNILIAYRYRNVYEEILLKRKILIVLIKNKIFSNGKKLFGSWLQHSHLRVKLYYNIIIVTPLKRRVFYGLD